MVRLIGIAGLAGAGKDTVADYLDTHYGFMRSAFADPLRHAAAAMFGIDAKYFHDRMLKEEPHPYWGMSPRRILQLLGNDAVKPVFGEDVWLKRWKLTYLLMADTDRVVVPDVRFDLEAGAIRELGGRVVHLIRPEAGLAGEAGAHVSEGGVTFVEGDYLLYNDGTIADLHDEIDLMLEAQ